MESDEVLMTRYVDGDPAAFDELFRRYAPLVLNLMRKHVGSEDDARDIAQLTFLHLHRARKDFRQGNKLRPWLMTIAFNLRREHFRRKGRRPEHALELDGVRDPAVEPTPISMSDSAFRVREALKHLNEDQREVITLHWFSELSFKEIADVVGASVSAVKVRAHRGYNTMRQVLGASGE
jgi:RNA polymerase sigma factor (sigma-70 family)